MKTKNLIIGNADCIPPFLLLLTCFLSAVRLVVNINFPVIEAP